MSYEMRGMCISLKASAKNDVRYAPVKISAADTFAVAGTADAADVIGFVQTQGVADEACPVMVNGVTFAVASAAITAGARVTAVDGGKVATATAKAASCGRALNAATKAGDVISVLIMCQAADTIA